MRLPRKRKKQAKKIVQRKNASKMAMTAIITANTAAENAMIVSMPNLYPNPAFVAEKSLKVAQNVMNAAISIKNILIEPPNSWKDFLKVS